MNSSPGVKVAKLLVWKLWYYTPPLNRAQVKIKCRDNISMAFFMSDQADFKYVKIKTFHLHTVPHRKLIFVTNV